MRSNLTAQNPQAHQTEVDSTAISEALIHAKEAAESANRAKDDFIASLSHELRSPLNPVLLLASEYARSPGLPAQMREDFQVILQNVRLQARLIDDLLDLTRIERGGVSISTRMLDLKCVLQEVQESLRSEADEKHIHLTLDVPAEVVSAWYVPIDNLPDLVKFQTISPVVSGKSRVTVTVQANQDALIRILLLAEID
jgi:signal transduction histidine kinase